MWRVHSSAVDDTEIILESLGWLCGEGAQVRMFNDKSSDNILTAGEEEMTLGGRLYASRQNAGMSLNLEARFVGVRSYILKSWEND